MTVGIMVATHNRCVELERSGRALSRLKPAPDEVLLFADGCTDGTKAVIRDHFRGARLLESGRTMGSVYCRDRMLRLAKSDITVSLDDDSYPVQTDFITRTRAAFAARPEADVIAFNEIRPDETVGKVLPGSSRYVPAYANCAAAMRTESYLRRPGFPRFFGHMYEEPDYALQCYAVGQAVWYEPSIQIHHHVSPRNRESVRRHHLNARNELWSTWMRCPLVLLPLLCVYRVVRQGRYAHSEGWTWLLREPGWWIEAAKGLACCGHQRRPVSLKAYCQWLMLARRPTDSREELNRRFDHL